MKMAYTTNLLQENRWLALWLMTNQLIHIAIDAGHDVRNPKL